MKNIMTLIFVPTTLYLYWKLSKLHEYFETGYELVFLLYCFILGLLLVVFVTTKNLKELKRTYFIGNEQNYFIFRSRDYLLKFLLLNLITWTLISTWAFLTTSISSTKWIEVLLSSTLMLIFFVTYNYLDTDYIFKDRVLYVSRLIGFHNISNRKASDLFYNRNYTKDKNLSSKRSALLKIILAPIVFLTLIYTYRIVKPLFIEPKTYNSIPTSIL